MFEPRRYFDDNAGSGAGGDHAQNQNGGDGSAGSADGQAAGEGAKDSAGAGAPADGSGAGSGDGSGKDGSAQPQPEAFDRAKLKLPEHTSLTQVDLDGLAEDAKALGLTLAQAQARLDAQHGMAAQFTEAVKTDAIMGGAQFETTRTLAAEGFTKVIERAKLTTAETEYVRAFFEGLAGNHPGFVRMFRYLGQQMKEDQPLHGGTPQGGPVDDAAKLDKMFPTTARKAS